MHIPTRLRENVSYLRDLTLTYRRDKFGQATYVRYRSISCVLTYYTTVK
jgi:hypothetical protein